MADAIALLVAVGLIVATTTGAVVLAVRRRREAAARQERERLEAPVRTQRYIDAVNAAKSPADLDALAEEFNDKRNN